MKCPHCFLELTITLLHTKEVDKCPKCEGIWLDRNNSENIFVCTDDGGNKDNTTCQDFQPKNLVNTAKRNGKG